MQRLANLVHYLSLVSLCCKFVALLAPLRTSLAILILQRVMCTSGLLIHRILSFNSALHDAPMCAKLEWLVHHLTFILGTHGTL